jgi:hypothetical protein
MNESSIVKNRKLLSPMIPRSNIGQTFEKLACLRSTYSTGKNVMIADRKPIQKRKLSNIEQIWKLFLQTYGRRP